tara:strand:+ start:391 stop:942 length:552 start_codon:yes stop_codon:yes gene_type:complete
MNQEIDIKLILSVIKQDQKSVRIFIDLCQSIIWGALVRFNQIDYEDKQDLCSQIIQKKIYGLNGDWEPLQKFRGDCKYSTYLYRIVMNETISFLKSKGMKYKPKTDSIDQVHNLFNEALDINDKLSLEQCLLELKEREREIINLAGQGYKQREIAEMLDEKPNTIAAIISRANRKLKKCMQDN